jgi:hypothetical protein
MPVSLYMNHNVRLAVTIGLRVRAVDVLTAYEDQHHTVGDEALLDRAHALSRVLFSQDDDLLSEAVKRQRASIPFGGIVYCHQERLGIGALIEELELVARASEPAELAQQVLFLPL